MYAALEENVSLLFMIDIMYGSAEGYFCLKALWNQFGTPSKGSYILFTSSWQYHQIICSVYLYFYCLTFNLPDAISIWGNTLYTHKIQQPWSKKWCLCQCTIIYQPKLTCTEVIRLLSPQDAYTYQVWQESVNRFLWSYMDESKDRRTTQKHNSSSNFVSEA